MQQQLGLGPPAAPYRSGGGLRAVQSSHVLDAYASRNSIAEDEEWPKAQSWDSALTPDQLAALIHQNQMGLGGAHTLAQSLNLVVVLTCACRAQMTRGCIDFKRWFDRCIKLHTLCLLLCIFRSMRLFWANQTSCH